MTQPSLQSRNYLPLMLIILAGEVIFFLPFVIARVFRPTFLEVFGINNLELGIVFSIYGVVAMVSYFLGGPLADRFASRKLMGIALVLTGIGGILMAQYPYYEYLKYLYGLWGMTTILLFWAAMIKATRVWGGKAFKGRAFGFLDAGRGIVAAGVGSICVFLFYLFLDVEADVATMVQKQEAFMWIIYLISGFTIITGIVIWIFLKVGIQEQEAHSRFHLSHLMDILKKPVVWLQAIIILCAYVGYKTTDDFSLLAKDVLGYDDIQSAQIGTLSLWMRVIVAIFAGIYADKISASKIAILGFGGMMAGAIFVSISHLIFPDIVQSTTLITIVMIIISLIVTSIGVYAIRAIYFSLLEEGSIPVVLTGTVTGIISVIGYTPDIFMGPAMGYLLDNSPGLQGHRHVFTMLAAFSALGLIAALLFHKLKINNQNATS